MIKILSFDFDGTLVKSSYADSVWLEGLPQLYAQEKQISLASAKQIVFEEYNRVGDKRKEWYDIGWWFQKFELSSDWKTLLNSYRHTVELYPETFETIQYLLNYYNISILSNAKHEFIDIQLQETGLRPFFSYIFSSVSDFGQVKKTPEIYKAVCQKLQCTPQEIVHVGDHKEFDFVYPRAFGIHAVYLDRSKRCMGEHVIHSLSELKTYLCRYTT